MFVGLIVKKLIGHTCWPVDLARDVNTDFTYRETVRIRRIGEGCAGAGFVMKDRNLVVIKEVKYARCSDRNRVCGASVRGLFC